MPSAELDQSYALTEPQITQFRKEGFLRLPAVLSRDTLAAYAPDIDAQVDARNANRLIPLAERSLYDQAFVQVSNLWETDERVRELVFSRRLARVATQLLGTRGVRLWHDQALYKEPSGGFTPWHVDQQYWPMESSLSVTAWIPLQPVPLEMGPLCFGRGSHLKQIGRGLPISAESERAIQRAVGKQNIPEVQAPFALGDVSFHLGWTLHRAGPNTTETPRRVMTIIYMDIDMRLADPKNKFQQSDWERWTPNTRLGEVMNDPRNPVVYSDRTSTESSGKTDRWLM